ncbi:MAG: molybdopterin-binding protein [Anaerolineae bacterium]|nr:molybdopterin-binding protein [Anaerolineae bacterium]
MKFGAVSLDHAAGKILAHNHYDTDGKKLLGKGHVLTEADVGKLRHLKLEQVVVADLAPTDLDEDEAAQRVGLAIAGANVRVAAPGVGRANLMADAFGPLRINVPVLERLNNIHEGITIATLREHTLVRPGDLLTLVKIIPFGIPAARVVDVEAVAHEAGGVIGVRPLRPFSAALIISGPESTREKMLLSFEGAVRARIEALGSTLDSVVYVEHDAPAIANAISLAGQAGRQLILIASISAIIDQEDVVPSALKLAGGSMAHFGVPVDPGSLLMLGYLNEIPVIGAPGCIKSPKTNVIDWILPRLLAGERLTRADLVAMGHGGLLEDIRERPMPRLTNP